GGELRVGNLYGQIRGQSLAAVVSRQGDFVFAGRAVLLRITGHLPRQCPTKPGQMGAAVALRAIVRKATDRLVIAVAPPQGAIESRAIALRPDQHRSRRQRAFVAIKEFYEGLYPTFVVHFLALLDRMTLVRKHDPHARIEERKLT